jgi:hypothetical protein
MFRSIPAYINSGQNAGGSILYDYNIAGLPAPD